MSRRYRSIKRAKPAQPQAGSAGWRRWPGLLSIACLCFSVSAGVAADGALQLSPTTSRDGVATLSWDDLAVDEVVLQQSSSMDFVAAITLYRGTDRGTTITGLNDGTYFYRVGINENHDSGVRWQTPVELVVEHHPISRAWTFFTLGAVVFVGTLILVVHGARLNGSNNR